MRREDLIITVSGTIAEGTAHPVRVSWTVKASVGETAEEIGKAVTLACRELNNALKDAVK